MSEPKSRHSDPMKVQKAIFRLSSPVLVSMCAGLAACAASACEESMDRPPRVQVTGYRGQPAGSGAGEQSPAVTCPCPLSVQWPGSNAQAYIDRMVVSTPANIRYQRLCSGPSTRRKISPTKMDVTPAASTMGQNEGGGRWMPR